MSIRLDDCNEKLQRRIKDALAAADAAKSDLHQRVGGLGHTVSEQREVQALDRRVKKQKRSKSSVAQVIVTIVSYRHRYIDDDNLSAGAKGLRDHIARSLACDDGDRRIRFEYDQVQTTGKTGTHVSITRL